MNLVMEPIKCGRCGHEEWGMDEAIKHQKKCRPLKQMKPKKRKPLTLEALIKELKEDL